MHLLLATGCHVATVASTELVLAPWRGTRLVCINMLHLGEQKTPAVMTCTKSEPSPDSVCENRSFKLTYVTLLDSCITNIMVYYYDFNHALIIYIVLFFVVENKAVSSLLPSCGRVGN